MQENEFRLALHKLLVGNVKEGYSRLLHKQYCYVAPSPQTYPFQWFWDTCFHVIMLIRLGEFECAKRNLQSLFAMQEENGFVGHMIFWKQVLPKRFSDILQARPSWRAVRPHMSALIQPPFVATVLLRLFEATHDRAFLQEMYPKVKLYHHWLRNNRDFDGDGLLTIISPFESGMDWKPSFDVVLGYHRHVPRFLYTSPLYWKAIAADFINFALRYDLPRIKKHRGFLVKAVAINTIYAMDLQAMAQLAELTGDEGEKFERLAQRVTSAIFELMFDEPTAAFYDVYGPNAKKIRLCNATLFFPLALEEVSPEIAQRILETHFDNKDEFALPFPIPSVPKNDATFSPYESSFIWRGPTWAFLNWFLYHALKKRRLDERAEVLRKSLWSLVDKSGFREYYNPFTGAGYGAQDFTWSGLLVDMDKRDMAVTGKIASSPPTLSVE